MARPPILPYYKRPFCQISPPELSKPFATLYSGRRTQILVVGLAAVRTVDFDALKSSESERNNLERTAQARDTSCTQEKRRRAGGAAQRSREEKAQAESFQGSEKSRRCDSSCECVRLCRTQKFRVLRDWYSTPCRHRGA